MSKRYLKRNPLFNALLASIDSILNLVLSHQMPKCGTPRRILLANGAHLGDVVMSTSVLPVLRGAFPAVEIGFIAGSWARQVVDDHPMVDRVHIVDHWRLNRTKHSRVSKIGQYWATRSNALREIRAEGYDIAIDLYTCFPNSIPLLWQASIPIRVGFVSSGFGPMLTHAEIFREGDIQHETAYQAQLLRLIPIESPQFDYQRSNLHESTPASASEVWKLFDEACEATVRYIVMHVGTGAEIKEWPLDAWRELAIKLSRDGYRLLFTGAGVQEHAKIEKIIHGLASCVNACNRLSWRGYVDAVRQAKAVIGVDTIAGHVAAALGTPCVVVYAGITRHERWGPHGDRVILLTKAVSCSPCFRKQGCAGMDCVRDIAPNDVFAAVKTLIGA
jgi:ADP-heptose:LPS heptosyltransferase